MSWIRGQVFVVVEGSGFLVWFRDQDLRADLEKEAFAELGRRAFVHLFFFFTTLKPRGE